MEIMQGPVCYATNHTDYPKFFLRRHKSFEDIMRMMVAVVSFFDDFNSIYERKHNDSVFL